MTGDMTEKDTPTVFVVDDDPAIRDSLEWLLSSVGMQVVTFGLAMEFLEKFEPTASSCLLADVRMPGMSGLDLQEELVARAINIPVIVITGHSDVQMAVRAMKAGAFDFIEKPFNDQALLELVQKAVEKSRTDARLSTEQTEFKARLNLLSPREAEVLGHIVDGKPNKQIAFHLGLSEKTVEAHRAKIMEKSQAGSLAELIRMVTLVGAVKGKP